MKNIIAFLQVHTYDITGVGNADEINQALTIGLPIIGAAIICLFLFNNGEKSVFKHAGCLVYIGPILFVIGLIALIPLLTWVELGVNVLIVVLVAIALLIWIISLFKKKGNDK